MPRWVHAVFYFLLDLIPMRCGRCGKIRRRKNGYWIAYASSKGYFEEWVCRDCS